LIGKYFSYTFNRLIKNIKKKNYKKNIRRSLFNHSEYRAAGAGFASFPVLIGGGIVLAGGYGLYKFFGN
jgi:hypothetical protein